MSKTYNLPSMTMCATVCEAPRLVECKDGDEKVVFKVSTTPAWIKGDNVRSFPSLAMRVVAFHGDGAGKILEEVKVGDPVMLTGKLSFDNAQGEGGAKLVRAFCVEHLGRVVSSATYDPSFDKRDEKAHG